MIGSNIKGVLNKPIEFQQNVYFLECSTVNTL